MKLPAYAVAALSFAVAGAAADPIEGRKELMKERGALMRVLGPIAKGERDFDAGTVLDALKKLNDNARATTDVATLWALGTDSGDTKSSPRIWEDLEAYQAASDKFAADTAAALEAGPADLDAFRAAFGPVAANCGACHESYRL